MRVQDHEAGGRRRRRGAVAAGIVLVAAGLALASIGCSSQKLVCVGKPAHVAVIASTSKTDYDVSAELAPAVADKAMRSAARSCGELLVGIQDGRPDANLELSQKRFEAPAEKEYDPRAVRKELFEEGDEFIEGKLLGPISEKKPVGGSPFFASVADARREADARGWLPITVVLVGDGFVVERSPRSHRMVRFGQESVSQETVNEFTEMLGDLHGSCILMVGFGAGSHLPSWRIQETEDLLAEAFGNAGATFVATRSPDIDPECSSFR